MERHEIYSLGYRHGSDSDLPDTRGIIGDREAYYEGYAKGSMDRDERRLRGEFVTVPQWMTKEQFEAIRNLYKRNPDGSPYFLHFFNRVREHGIGSDRYAGINWRGMFIGIERDGYTHS